MSLPLKFYRALSYIQLTVSLYAFIWLGMYFSSSVSCSTIDNRASVAPFLLRYGDYFLPECSSGGVEWIIGVADSVALRILFIAWIVISFFVFMRVRKIRRYVSESEPVEFIQTPASKKGRKSKKVTLFGNIKDFIPEFEVPRLLKIMVSVTALWIIAILLFQGSILTYMTKYIQEQKFTGEITSIDIRYSKDGTANIYTHIDQNLILLRSDRNILSYATESHQDNGIFFGLEQFELEDELLPQCLIGNEVEVFARKSGIFYSLDDSDRYYIRFTKGTPTCQSIYLNSCVNGDESYEFGEKLYYEENGVVCECTVEGFECEKGEVVVNISEAGESCRYFDASYNSGQSFTSEDGCGECSCDDGHLSCTQNDRCEIGEYDLSKDFEIPLYYWFVDEPDPSRIVYLTAGRSDSYEVVAYKSFGQSPKTELSLSNGEVVATLIFTDSHLTTPIWSPEIKGIEGNSEYPEMVRIYSKDSLSYLYAESIASLTECSSSGAVGEQCIVPALDGINVECKSTDGGYDLCDQVMRGFGLGE